MVSVMALLLIGVLLIALYSTMHQQGEGKGISLQADTNAEEWNDSAVRADVYKRQV